MQRNHKKPSKHNVKRKALPQQREDGLLPMMQSQNKRFPIVSLPEIITVPRHHLVVRYINNGSAVNFNFSDLSCAQILMIAVTSTSLVSMIKACRIKKIRALSPVTTQGTSVTLSMTPSGVDNATNNFNALPETFTDTSASIDIPAYICLKPSISTPLGSWHLSDSGVANQNLLTIIAPAGTTLDIFYEFTLNQIGANTSPALVVAGATVGTVYTRPLAGANLVPQSVNTL
jgi:hypothetical protein